MLALKTGDSFFEIDFSRKCYAANRSSVTLYKICGKSGYGLSQMDGCNA